MTLGSEAGMSASDDGAIRRSLRRFLLGSGPLKRRSDRLQVMGRLVVALSFLVSPPIAVATTNAVTAHLQEVAAAEAAERFRTSAVLLEDARAPAHDLNGGYGDSADRPVPAWAGWTAPGGTSREGTVAVPPRTPAGTSVQVWVDGDGDLTRAPRDGAGIRGTAATIGALPLIGVPLAAWALYAGLCFSLDAHRQRRWTQDWAEVEPDWHSRLL
jgi:hypothetical protein